MPDSSLSDALDRLARAIDRIDAAAETKRPDPALAALEQRHADLRARIEQTIARLDAMLESAA